MPIFLLDDSMRFPDVEQADAIGILALGGDLSVERLLKAYAKGIFPWYSLGEPILWWSPNPRMVLMPEDLKVSKSMKQVLNQQKFQVSFDQDFLGVIENCKKSPRKDQEGTWITDEMKQAYLELHKAGYAHSVEVRQEGELVGGLYGVSLGACFFGESMFTKVSNASKVGFISLNRKLAEKGFQLIDCQVYTAHLESLGAKELPRKEFLNLLEEGLKAETLKGNWEKLFRSP